MGVIGGSIYKPERILYYLNPTEEEKEAFLNGKIPALLKKYDGAFGTYDSPSLFKVHNGSEQIEVIGIEFRPDDKRIVYPMELESVRLSKCFMISALFQNVECVNDKFVDEAIDQIQNSMEVMAFHSQIVEPLKNPNVMQISVRKDHTIILVEANASSDEEFFCSIQPVSDNEKELYNAAYFDAITGHYNWNYLWPIITAYGLKGIQDFAFVHFDVKDFNALNVIYGHDVANHVLTRIATHMRELDYVYYSARCDNDNFSMMIKDMPEEEMYQKLFDFFDYISVLEEDPNYHIYYRCGVVPMRNTILLGARVADAGKQVQRMGCKPYETEVLFYTDQMRDDLDWSIRTRTYLDTAIEQEEFLVYLQPKYNVESEQLTGAEALIRWKYHGKELLSPYRFVPVFETGGIISKLDDFVLRKVCQYIKKWENEGKPLLPVSVNLSRKSMGKPNLTKHLTQIVDSYGVKHEYIEFELTESATYDNQEYMIKIIRELKENGFLISMDDFGTGYSSLSLLTVMPLDTIKIDKSFVDRIGKSVLQQKDCVLLKHMIAMIKDLKFTCLAEGIETKEQLEIVRKLGCQIVQGYYFSKPVPVEEYEALLQ